MLALGAAFSALTIAASILLLPEPLRPIGLALFLGGVAIAMGAGVIDYASHLLARDEAVAQRALKRTKGFLAFFLGMLCVPMGYFVILAVSVWVGGVA